MKSFKEFLANEADYNPSFDGEPLYPRTIAQFVAQIHHLARWSEMLGEGQKPNVQKAFNEAAARLSKVSQVFTLSQEPSFSTRTPGGDANPDTIWGKDLVQ